MKINIGVIFGGKSVEHEISIISALQAISSFDTEKYTTTPIYITKEGVWYTGEALLNVDNYKNIQQLTSQCTEIHFSSTAGDFAIHRAKKSFWNSKPVTTIDLAFPIIHGTNGEDGTIQGLLELKGIPYVGCNVLASAIGMDKIMMKMVLKESSIPTVDYTWFTDKDWHRNRETILAKIDKLGFPVIVKPSNLGSSIGISKAKDQQELSTAIEFAGNFSSRILVEKMITDLKEINCAVLGDSEEQLASVCEEPLRSGDILSYQDKYLSKGGKSSKGMSSTKRQIPADISTSMSEEIQKMARDTFKTLDCSGVARIDFLIDTSSNQVYVNEINTIPGSLSFYLWEAGDKNFKTLLDDLVNIALKQKREKDNFMVSYDENIFDLNMGSLKLGKS